MRDDIKTQFERLFMLLIYDEMLNLFAHKLADASGEGVPIKESRLDKVVSEWQEVFPDSKILREGSRILFSRQVGDSYSSMKLSDGEKAGLYNWDPVRCLVLTVRLYIQLMTSSFYHREVTILWYGFVITMLRTQHGIM